MKVIIICFLAFSILLVAYLYAESKMLIVRRYKIKFSKAYGKKINVVQISDIHEKTYPKNWEKLCKKIKALSPDMIIISGDLVSRNHENFEYTGKLIKELSQICNVFYAKGNHELDLIDDKMSKLRSMAKENGAVLLENRCVQHEIKGISLNIYGADLKKRIYRNEKNGFSNLDSYSAQELEAIFGKPETPSILIAHNPFFFSEYAQWGADITFSGHVHAGIINTPFGGILSPERKFFPLYTKGIYQKNNNRMVVSAGIGKFRAFNPSEVLFLEIEF